MCAVASSDAAAHGVTSSTAARAGLKLDERTESMTVEQFLRSYLADMCDKANAVVDGAIDDVSLLYKQLREETQNYRHQKRAEEHARNKAGACCAQACVRFQTQTFAASTNNKFYHCL
ncbi:hypothetical protein EON66_08125 [archaeon]|nr:MAG: hypothetical protein EON66_08125 [archaeon]